MPQERKVLTPDQGLARLRDLLDEGRTDGWDGYQVREVIALIDAMDRNLSTAGYLPKAWQNARKP